ncbi:hypothetical protein FHX42_002113 [Saccharopolyspora lacisalsi]|uniref:Uncharacterized protein n=1 Tax=Halosaccharopolyspora lacisalsi TaxID=1000566 RepID=A0A839DX07_9PSEU|nr:hypothetical protein [Halosaccharopolyspora lacisalsi]MBA8824766.1 hypothetical protein [Halosaccharopolyspora lacisalsi]
MFTLRDSPREVRLTLLAALCWMRQTEITDSVKAKPTTLAPWVST